MVKWTRDGSFLVCVLMRVLNVCVCVKYLADKGVNVCTKSEKRIYALDRSARCNSWLVNKGVALRSVIFGPANIARMFRLYARWLMVAKMPGTAEIHRSQTRHTAASQPSALASAIFELTSRDQRRALVTWSWRALKQVFESNFRGYGTQYKHTIYNIHDDIV